MSQKTSPPAKKAQFSHFSWKSVIGWFVALAVIFMTAFGFLFVAERRSPIQPTATIFVSPHPDDEFQMWSLVEDRPEEYKVFVFLTLGEETRFCDPDVYEEALQVNLGEIPASPTPEGRASKACEEARVASTLGYFQQMSIADETVPGDFSDPKEFGLPGDGPVEVCRTDSDVTSCDPRFREVSVFHDELGRGAVVFFNLGDGDLTAPEATLAIETLLSSREEWGLAAERPVGPIVGAFANDGTRCFSYPHPDHLVVRDVLWNIDFGAGPQLGATCYVGRSQRMSSIVSTASSEASFALDEDGVRVGAHGLHYGWLHADAYPVSRLQNSLFHRLQSFWVRFN